MEDYNNLTLHELYLNGSNYKSNSINGSIRLHPYKFNLTYPFTKKWSSVIITLRMFGTNGLLGNDETIEMRIASRGGLTMEDYINEANCGGYIP